MLINPNRATDCPPTHRPKSATHRSMAAAAWADGVSVIDGGAAALAAAKERVNVAPVDHVESTARRQRAAHT